MKLINKTCSCGKAITDNIRKRYCHECAIKNVNKYAKEVQRRKKLNLPNQCNVCNQEIPANKQKCKRCLGYNKVCGMCKIDFSTGKKHQKFCKPICYYDFVASGIAKEKSDNQDHQEVIKRYKALQNSYNILEAVDKTNVQLLDTYRNENQLMKKELEWLKSIGDNIDY